MNSKSLTCCIVFLLYTSSLFSSTSESSLIHFNSTTSVLNVTLPHSLSQSLENFALKTLTTRHHTGALYRAILPENLSGIEVYVVRLTGKSLWNSGAKFSNVLIPARSVSVPPARRVAIVYQNLGNWSNHWYTVPGYRLIASVLGFKVLDVSDQDNVKELSLRIKNPVEVSFRDLPKDTNEKMLSKVRCVSFKAQTKDEEATHISRMVLPGVCYGSSHGDYSVVEPLENNKKKVESWWTWWWLWIVGFVLGFGVLLFLGLVCTMGIRVSRTKKIQVMMERHAVDGEVFESRWVGGSKMPSATVTRTQPEPESGFETGSLG
ncbi:hypothetical protein CARUB_v10005264mg [Capsella rubella]|uniref:Legume lectin domain-containing protein n=1 Tax=Capsella rubella TaxID=81985 RepID=B2WS82_9BRAS|nr:uncharacterized protein LOC17878172 [Capsella rubella]ACC91254.1 unknown [Capsella rubella]EOA17032.1 hypothetical protein CARUB_v10005264mg [Capsella rubella]